MQVLLMMGELQGPTEDPLLTQGPLVATTAALSSAVDAMLPLLPAVEVVPVLPEARAVVQSCVVSVFTVLLHHNHLTALAQSFAAAVGTGAADTPLPLDLLRCWKAANRYVGCC